MGQGSPIEWTAGALQRQVADEANGRRGLPAVGRGGGMSKQVYWMADVKRVVTITPNGPEAIWLAVVEWGMIGQLPRLAAAADGTVADALFKALDRAAAFSNAMPTFVDVPDCVLRDVVGSSGKWRHLLRSDDDEVLDFAAVWAGLAMARIEGVTP